MTITIPISPLSLILGVGISGKEGRQAVNSSDFSIGQFRFLKRLLLVHGRLNYRRMCKVILFSFYKNIVLTLILFGFTFRSGFSAQSLFDDYVHSAYNVILAFPVISFGVYDKVSTETNYFRDAFFFCCLFLFTSFALLLHTFKIELHLHPSFPLPFTPLSLLPSGHISGDAREVQYVVRIWPYATRFKHKHPANRNGPGMCGRSTNIRNTLLLFCGTR
jgi:Phospholipid-translocating P-type ATPase C-terminal